MVSYELTQNVEMFHVVESREENLDKDACMCARVPHGSTEGGGSNTWRMGGIGAGGMGRWQGGRRGEC